MTEKQLKTLLEIAADEAADFDMAGKTGYGKVYDLIMAALNAIDNRQRHCEICNSGVCDHVWPD